MSMILDGSNGVTFNDSSLQGAAASPYVLKNRIINGDMRIDQRNAGASVTITNTSAATYTLDRWAVYGSQASKFSVQQVSANANTTQGFDQSLRITSASAYSIGSGDIYIVGQKIEGYNITDLAWGTASAKTVTISFWVRSSLTGTFGGTLSNNAFDRSYPFTYTISAANTWEQKSITISGDTSGTWLTTNGTGLTLWLGLGCGSSVSGTAGSWQAAGYYSATGATSVVGTNGATFYITGVQLEIGSTATPFERRMYGQELQLCQRYYEKSYAQGTVPGTATEVGMRYNSTLSANTTSYLSMTLLLTVPKRTSPTNTYYDAAGTSAKSMRGVLGVGNSNGQNIAEANLSETSALIYSNGTSNSAFMGVQFTSSAEL